mmetsp:Transcript_46284/g.128664  ORF Transcript_46284/g.128664 Transcript_46284/m.128664 type:complete len:301 (-) Transcript_46284:1054-1956(-)
MDRRRGPLLGQRHRPRRPVAAQRRVQGPLGDMGGQHLLGRRHDHIDRLRRHCGGQCQGADDRHLADAHRVAVVGQRDCDVLRRGRDHQSGTDGVPADDGRSEPLHAAAGLACGDAHALARVLPSDAAFAGRGDAAQPLHDDVATAARRGRVGGQFALAAQGVVPQEGGAAVLGAGGHHARRDGLRAGRGGGQRLPVHCAPRHCAVRRQGAHERQAVGRGYDPHVAASAEQVLRARDELPRGLHDLARRARRGGQKLPRHVQADPPLGNPDGAAPRDRLPGQGRDGHRRRRLADRLRLGHV